MPLPRKTGSPNVAVASHGSPTWTRAIRGTVREAEIIGAAAYLLHTPPSGLTVHVVDASIIGAQLRTAQEALYRGIKGSTSHFINQPALNLVVQGRRQLPRRVGGPHYSLVRQSSHFAAVPLEGLDFAAAHAKAPPIHLMLPKERATLLVPDEGEVVEPRMPSMGALQRVIEAAWDALAAHTRVRTHHWLVLVKLCLWERCIMALHIGTCCERQRAVCPPCKSCDGGGKKKPAW